MKRGVYLLALAGTAGCAHLAVVDDGLDYVSRRAELESVHTWEMRGRLTVDADGEAYQGRFRWHQDADRINLSIRGPLGAGGVRISGTPSALTVTARGEQWALTDPEPQLSELMGWWIPVNSLSTWLLGIPDGSYEAVPTWDEHGRLAALQQRFWSLNYPTYQLTDRLTLPREIDMSYASLTLKLTVDNWTRESDSITP